jgi:hypothetical protein
MKIISVHIFTVFRVTWRLAVVLYLAVLLFFLWGQTVQAASINGLCLTDREFWDVNSMNLDSIRAWLDNQGGYLKGTNYPIDGTPFTFIDVDGDVTDPALVIFLAATTPFIDPVTGQEFPGMNPRILLTTLYKEKPLAFVDPLRPTNRTLQRLAGWGTPSASARAQIQGGANQLKRDFYGRLAQCNPTIGNWQIDTARQTGEPNSGDEKYANGTAVSVTPENKVVAALYSYTPWAGEKFGGGFRSGDARIPGTGEGGNGYFCDLWNQFLFEAPPSDSVSVDAPNPTLFCSKCISLNASGGTSPYTWSINKPDAPFTVTGVNQQNARVRPPTNNGGYPGVQAYFRAGMNKSCADNSNMCKDGRATQGCSATAAANAFGCSDQNLGSWGVATACGGVAYGFNMQFQYCSTISAGSIPARGTCFGKYATCNGKSYTQACSGTGVELFTDRKDNRTAAMISAGCRPCLLEMEGTTVTVTDAASSSTTVNVTVK